MNPSSKGDCQLEYFPCRRNWPGEHFGKEEGWALWADPIDTHPHPAFWWVRTRHCYSVTLSSAAVLAGANDHKSKASWGFSACVSIEDLLREEGKSMAVSEALAPEAGEASWFWWTQCLCVYRGYLFSFPWFLNQLPLNFVTSPGELQCKGLATFPDTWTRK